MKIGMTSKDESLIAMSMMAYWTIRARILRVQAWPTSPSGASGCR